MKNTSNDAQRKFCINQIKNTKKIIDQFSNNMELSSTVLLNSLLSFVVLPFESVKQKNGERVFQGKMAEINKNLGFTPDIFVPIKSCINNDITFGKRTIYEYVNKLRNAIAHQNINITVDENRIIHISLYNIFEGKDCKKCNAKKCKEKGLSKTGRGICDFRITVNISQLKKLAMYVANSYLNSIEGE